MADTDDEALAATRDAHGRWYRSITKLWHDHDGHSPDGLFAWETATQHETILFGSPARVREQLPRLLEVSGCNYVIGAFAWGTLTAAQTRRSLRLFAEEVMPAFTESTAPVASGPGLVNLSHRLYNSGLVCDICLMNTPGLPNHYKHHRFPIEIISHAVWLYFRFCLSYRDVEELLFARGVTVTYEAIRKWCRKFGQPYANALRHRRPKPGDTWHLDEVFLTINGTRSYLWRAVDQEGNILDILVQRRRDKNAAKTFFRKLLKGLTYVPRVIVTDQLKSYGAAMRELLPGVEHRQHRSLNNRAENSHQPTRQRERRMQGFKSPGHAQRFLAAYGPITSHFRPRRHRLPAPVYRQEMRQRFQSWREVTSLATAA